MFKIVLCGQLNTDMAKTVTLGSANPSTVTNLEGQKWLLFIPKTAWIKIAQKWIKIVCWSPLNAKMAKTVTLSSANPLTVTNLGKGGTKNDFIYLEDGKDKNCLKNIYWWSTEHINGWNSYFRFAASLTVTNLEKSSKIAFIYLKTAAVETAQKRFLVVHWKQNNGNKLWYPLISYCYSKSHCSSKWDF